MSKNHYITWYLKRLYGTEHLSFDHYQYELSYLESTFLNISINKNAVVGDTSALQPGGIRIGTSALTSRGLVEEDFVVVVNFIDKAIKLAIKIQEKVGKKLVDFKKELINNNEIEELRKEIEQFANSFTFDY